MAIKTKTDKQNTRLPNLIQYFEVCNQSEGKSPKTVSWYSANLRRFHRYLKSRHLPDSVADLDIQTLREYVLYLQKQKKFAGHPYTPSKSEFLSPASIHGHVRTLRAFLSWLAREGLLESNLGSSLKPPKIPRKIVSTLSDEEIRSILNMLRATNPCDARNQSIVMILIDTGLRIKELTNLKMDDLNLDQGVLKVMGKGDKERIVPIGNNAQRALQRYLFRYRPKPAHPGIDNVFLSLSGAALSENSMKLMFTRLSKRSGVTRLHAHLCRHTFATRFLINGGDVFTLQQILGHTTLEMVRHYLHFTTSQVAALHHKYSPMDKLYGEEVKAAGNDALASAGAK